MKKFFIAFLGSMAGIWFSLFIAFFGLIIVCAVAAASGAGSSGTKEVKKGSYLTIDLTNGVSDRPGQLKPMQVLKGETDIPLGLNTIIGAIEAAASDSNIDGLVIESGISNVGMAQLQAIGEAIDRFRKEAPEKWIYAYADTYTLPDYYLATRADSIFLNPIGMIDIHGIGQTGVYFKDLLDKLGVEVQVVKVGTYKSAVEPFILNEMSEPAREQARLYLDNIWGHIAGNIAGNRNISVDSVNMWANSYLVTRPAEDYLKLKVVDRLMYRHEFNEKLMALTDVDAPDELKSISIKDYAIGRDFLKKGSGKGANIAVLYACGEIFDTQGDGIVAADLIPEIEKLTDEDTEIDGLIMYVNSPGGSAFASEQIWEALQQFKSVTGKPFYVAMSDYAASGGYYISCGADKIFAQPTTITGSIGIYGMVPNAQKLLNDKLGVHISTVRSCENGEIPGLFNPMSPSLRNAMQGYVNRGYELFTSRCAKGRSMSQDSIKTIAEGRVWDGAEALKIGLVDQLGTLDDAIAAMAEELNVETWTVKEYPSVEQKWYELLVEAGADFEAGIVNDRLGDLAPFYRQINNLNNMSVLQARMEIAEIRL